jgi:hypothetical protein
VETLSLVLLERFAGDLPATALLALVVWVALRQATKVANGTTRSVQTSTEDLGTQVKLLASSVMDLRATITVLNSAFVELKVGQARIEERVAGLEKT